MTTNRGIWYVSVPTGPNILKTAIDPRILELLEMGLAGWRNMVFWHVAHFGDNIPSGHRYRVGRHATWPTYNEEFVAPHAYSLETQRPELARVLMDRNHSHGVALAIYRDIVAITRLLEQASFPYAILSHDPRPAMPGDIEAELALALFR